MTFQEFSVILYSNNRNLSQNLGYVVTFLSHYGKDVVLFSKYWLANLKIFLSSGGIYLSWPFCLILHFQYHISGSKDLTPTNKL